MKKLSRPSRVIAAFIALLSMLFMQFAMASYVCPGMNSGNGSGTAVMSKCENMDMAQSGLCHAHAHDLTSKQSLDKPELPSVQPFVPGGLVLAVMVDLAARPLATPPESSLLTRSTAPPIAIRNCCFRI